MGDVVPFKLKTFPEALPSSGEDLKHFSTCMFAIRDNFKGVAKRLVHEKADEFGLSGLTRLTFVALDVARVSGLSREYSNAAMDRILKGRHEDAYEILETLAYPQPAKKELQ